jgi:hypothetical protein
MFYLKKIIRLKVSPNSHRSVSLVFAHSVIVAFFAEMFFSGAGYFTPGVLLVIVSYFLIQENNRIDNNFVKTR